MRTCVCAAETQHVGHLRRGVLLLPVEHVGARNVGRGQFVDFHVHAVGNDSDQRVVGQEGKVLLQSVLQTVELLDVDSRIDDEEEHGRDALTTLDFVLHGGVGGHHFVGQRGLGNVLRILRREVVALSAEGAGPQLRAEVNLTRPQAGRTNRTSTGSI